MRILESSNELEQILKKIAKSAARLTVLNIRKAIVKHPRLKNSIKRVLIAQLSSSKNMNTHADWLGKNLPDFIDLIGLKASSGELKFRPLISIIVPTYDTDIDFLHECIDSVRAQVYKNWELCIVDDASPN